jgi:hypothetical protein
MTTVHATTTINATREQIRPMFFDAARLLERDKNLIRYEPDPDWPRVGAKLASTFKTFLMEVNQVGTCVGYNPDTMRLEFTTESEQAPRPGRWLYTFDEQDGRTMVSLTIEYYLPETWLGKAFDRLLVERMNKQQVDEHLKGLKQDVEAAVAGAA